MRGKNVLPWKIENSNKYGGNENILNKQKKVLAWKIEDSNLKNRKMQCEMVKYRKFKFEKRKEKRFNIKLESFN